MNENIEFDEIKGYVFDPELVTTHNINHGMSIKYTSVADLNNDGYIDIIGFDYNNNEIIWLENDGELNFNLHTISENEVNIKAVFSLDIDLDGDIDVVTLDSKSNVIQWFENKSGLFISHILNDEDPTNRLEIADMNGDGFDDIVTLRDHGIYWYEYSKNNTFNTISIREPGTKYTNAFQLADLDSDGDIDINST